MANVMDRLNEWRRQIQRGISPQVLGTFGEDIARTCFEHVGYSVAKADSNFAGDLWVYLPCGDRVKVEVKTARQGSEKRWRYCLKKTSAQGNTTCHHADVVLLIQITKINIYAFLVPCRVIGNRSYLSVRSPQPDYKGWLSDYAVSLESLVLPL